MRTYVEAGDSSSDDADSVIEVPFVKPKPPVIHLSGSEGEEDDDEGRGTEMGSEASVGPDPNGSPPLKKKRRKGDSPKKGNRRKDDERGGEGESQNDEAGPSGTKSPGVRTSGNVTRGVSSPIPQLTTSNNIFDPSQTAMSETTSRTCPPADPLPKVTPEGGTGSKAPRKRTSSKTASNDSFVSFLKSINLPVPDEFLSGPKKKAAGGTQGRAKKGKSVPSSDGLGPSSSQRGSPAGSKVTVTEGPKAKGSKRVPKKGLPAAPPESPPDLTLADLASVHIDIQHNLVDPQGPKGSRKDGTGKRKRTAKASEERKSRQMPPPPSPLKNSKKRKETRDRDRDRERGRDRDENNRGKVPKEPSNLPSNWDDDIEMPKSAIPSGWNLEMRDFYCKTNNPDFDTDAVLRNQPNGKSRWAARLDDLAQKKPRRKGGHIRCDNCKQRGHHASKCPDKWKGKICSMCGESGHLSSEENSCHKTVCLNCGTRQRKFQSACEQCIYRPRAIDCRLCGMKGHEEKGCPDHWRRFHSTTVDIPGIVTRVEEGRKEVAQKEVRLEELHKTAESHELGVATAESEVRRTKKEPLGPGGASKKKELQEVEAAEKVLKKAETQRKRTWTAIKKEEDEMRLVKEELLRLETEFWKYGPEVVDVEADVLVEGPRFKYKPRFRQYCANCGHKGHNYFMCPGPKYKSPYFPNKPFVIQELPPPPTLPARIPIAPMKEKEPSPSVPSSDLPGPSSAQPSTSSQGRKVVFQFDESQASDWATITIPNTAGIPAREQTPVEDDVVEIGEMSGVQAVAEKVRGKEPVSLTETGGYIGRDLGPGPSASTTTADTSVSSTSGTPPPCPPPMDIDERMFQPSQYIPVPVPVPVPQEEYERYMKTGFSPFAPQGPFYAQFQFQASSLGLSIPAQQIPPSTLPNGGDLDLGWEGGTEGRFQTHGERGHEGRYRDRGRPGRNTHDFNRNQRRFQDFYPPQPPRDYRNYDRRNREPDPMTPPRRNQRYYHPFDQ